VLTSCALRLAGRYRRAGDPCHLLSLRWARAGTKHEVCGRERAYRTLYHAYSGRGATFFLGSCFEDYSR
jgi:hypothetical protein